LAGSISQEKAGCLKEYCNLGLYLEQPRKSLLVLIKLSDWVEQKQPRFPMETRL